MRWIVEFADEFEPEFDRLPRAVQDELLAQALVIGRFGPHTGRPRVDTLHGSRYAGMKELRFEAAGGAGVWHLHSTGGGVLSCSLVATSPASVSDGSTAF